MKKITGNGELDASANFSVPPLVSFRISTKLSEFFVNKASIDNNLSSEVDHPTRRIRHFHSSASAIFN
jgi:hypothetical protein